MYWLGEDNTKFENNVLITFSQLIRPDLDTTGQNYSFVEYNKSIY